MNLIIRREHMEDQKAVEELTREAFWNVYMPGASEHLLAHKLRESASFLPELDFVAESDGKIVGNIMYSLSLIEDESGTEFDVITFGPLSVLPEFQGRGVGTALIEHSKKAAAEMGFDAIIIFGNPEYYSRFGFKSAESFGIRNAEGKFAAAQMALELKKGALRGVSGRAHEAPVFEDLPQDELDAFDALFPYKEKLETESQKDFLRLAASVHE